MGEKGGGRLRQLAAHLRFLPGEAERAARDVGALVLGVVQPQEQEARPQQPHHRVVLIDHRRHPGQKADMALPVQLLPRAPIFVKLAVVDFPQLCQHSLPFVVRQLQDAW